MLEHPETRTHPSLDFVAVHVQTRRQKVFSVTICSPASGATVNTSFVARGTFAAPTTRITGCTIGTKNADSINNDVLSHIWSAGFSNVTPGTYNLTATGDNGSTATVQNIKVGSMVPFPASGCIMVPSVGAERVGSVDLEEVGIAWALKSGATLPSKPTSQTPAGPLERPPVTICTDGPKLPRVMVGGHWSPIGDLPLVCRLGDSPADRVVTMKDQWQATFENPPEGKYLLTVTQGNEVLATVELNLVANSSRCRQLDTNATTKS